MKVGTVGTTCAKESAQSAQYAQRSRHSRHNRRKGVGTVGTVCAKGSAQSAQSAQTRRHRWHKMRKGVCTVDAVGAEGSAQSAQSAQRSLYNQLRCYVLFFFAAVKFSPVRGFRHVRSPPIPARAAPTKIARRKKCPHNMQVGCEPPPNKSRRAPHSQVDYRTYLFSPSFFCFKPSLATVSGDEWTRQSHSMLSMR